MAKAKAKRTRSKASFTIPMGVIGGFVPLGLFAYEGFKVGGLPNAGGRIAQRLTGWDYAHNTFVWSEIAKGWGPIIAGVVAHKLANRFGINRALGRAGVPLLRI